jgi:hypothetical protein
MSDPIESAILDRFCWWPLPELASSRERLTPLALPQIVSSYLDAGAPAAVPVEVVFE